MYKNSVPPNIEKWITALIRLLRMNYNTVRFDAGTAQMEATISGFINCVVLRTVKLPDGQNERSVFCAYSNNGDGLLCFNSVAVLCETHGASNKHCFMETRHWTTAWLPTYSDITFTIPSQFDVNNVVSKAKLLIFSGANLHIPPPRGRPVKNAGVWRKG